MLSLPALLSEARSSFDGVAQGLHAPMISRPSQRLASQCIEATAPTPYLLRHLRQYLRERLSLGRSDTSGLFPQLSRKRDLSEEYSRTAHCIPGIGCIARDRRFPRASPGPESGRRYKAGYSSSSTGSPDMPAVGEERAFAMARSQHMQPGERSGFVQVSSGRAP